MEKKIRVLIAKPGLDGHDRGALVIAQALRDYGMEVIYTGLRQTPEQIVAAAIQEDVDAIGLSCLSGAHNELFPAVTELLKTRGADDILVIGGGIIPAEDVPFLESKGIRKIFTPGTPTIEIARYIERAVYERDGIPLEQPIEVEAVDHIGIAVRSIADCLPFYQEKLGFSLERTETVEAQKVKVAFLKAGNFHLELLEPIGDDSPVARFIAQRGEGLHHVALEVRDIDGQLRRLETAGIPLVDHRARPGAGASRIAFLHPKAAHGVLYELCEKKAEH